MGLVWEVIKRRLTKPRDSSTHSTDKRNDYHDAIG
jgi:hypothetical protein